MNIDNLIGRFHNCTCGRKHNSVVKAVHIAPGIVKDAGRYLRDSDFPQDILLVADENTITSSKGLLWRM